MSPILYTFFSLFEIGDPGNCEEELPKKPVGRQLAVCRPTVGRQSADSRPTDGRQVLPEI